uniref:Peptidase S1 domain-containing protein n=1 Tax=Anopheles atroparvus TaxID=41427 RepID=A0AAG5DM67_ANOAO
MDKLTTISAALFMAADVCAIVSLAMPDWIVTSVGGRNMVYGGNYPLKEDVLYSHVFRFRRNTLGTDVDVHDAVQSAPSMLHAGAPTGVANRADMHFRRMHLHHHYDHPAGIEQLGSQCYTVRPVGWLYRNGTVLSGGSDISTRVSRRRNRRTTVPSTELAPGWNLVHHVRAGPVDHGHIGTVCRKGLSTAVLIGVARVSSSCRKGVEGSYPCASRLLKYLLSPHSAQTMYCNRIN